MQVGTLRTTRALVVRRIRVASVLASGVPPLRPPAQLSICPPTSELLHSHVAVSFRPVLRGSPGTQAPRSARLRSARQALWHETISSGEKKAWSKLLKGVTQ